MRLTLTATGSAMGTPAYMSPEQCMGRELDVRSDIYALGVTAFYALTGEKPFNGRSSFEIMTKQREHKPPLVDAINPQVPHIVAEMVSKMLEKRPEERFESAEICRQEWWKVGVDLGYFEAAASSGPMPAVIDSLGSSDSSALPVGVSYPTSDDVQAHYLHPCLLP